MSTTEPDPSFSGDPVSPPAVLAAMVLREGAPRPFDREPPAPDTERDERLRRRREHDELLRRRVERNLADIMDSEAGRRCVSCAHLKHNDLGYCQVGQCSCTVGTSLAGTASVVLRDASALLDRQAAEVARLDSVVTAVRELATDDLSFAGERSRRILRALDGVDKQS